MAQTTTMTLVDFLGQRLDDDEAAARDVLEPAGTVVVPRAAVPIYLDDPGAAARMLREVEAKRAIVALYTEADASHDRDDASATQYMESAAMALAAAYSDHPDFREGWRP